ncbi:hypothetical protein CR513_53646, partial [Mucuna pruriens]
MPQSPSLGPWVLDSILLSPMFSKHNPTRMAPFIPSLIVDFVLYASFPFNLLFVHRLIHFHDYLITFTKDIVTL